MPRQRTPRCNHRVERGIGQRAPFAARASLVGRGVVGDQIQRLLFRDEARPRGEHMAPVLGLSLIHPQQAGAHWNVEVRRPELGGPPVLAIPRVCVLVSQKIFADKACGPCREIAAAHAIIAGALVLNAGRSEAIAYRDEEIVVIEMPGAEQFVGLHDQVAVNLQNLRRDLNLCRLVPHDVERNARTAAGIKIVLPHVLACEQRAVDHRLPRCGLEPDNATGD